LSAKKVPVLPSPASAQLRLPPVAKELARQVPPSARLAALPTARLAGGVPAEKAPTSASPSEAPGAVGERKRMENVVGVANSAPAAVTLGSAVPHAGGSLPQRKSRKAPETRPQQQSARGYTMMVAGAP
jgi:hypothetical protein